MKQLDISIAARRDLGEIRDFSVERFGGEVSAGYLAGFDAAFRRILDFPELGELSSNIKPPTRVLVHRRHRIYYRVTKAEVQIVRVFHTAQNARVLLN